MVQPNDSEDLSHKKNDKLLAHAVMLLVVEFTKCIAYMQYLSVKHKASLILFLCCLSILQHYTCHIFNV